MRKAIEVVRTGISGLELEWPIPILIQRNFQSLHPLACRLHRHSIVNISGLLVWGPTISPPFGDARHFGTPPRSLPQVVMTSHRRKDPICNVWLEPPSEFLSHEDWNWQWKIYGKGGRSRGYTGIGAPRNGFPPKRREVV